MGSPLQLKIVTSQKELSLLFSSWRYYFKKWFLFWATKGWTWILMQSKNEYSFGNLTLLRFYFCIFSSSIFYLFVIFTFLRQKNTIKYFPFSFLWEKLLSHCVHLSIGIFPFFQISADLIRRRFLRHFCIPQRNQTSVYTRIGDVIQIVLFRGEKNLSKEKLFFLFFFTNWSRWSLGFSESSTFLIRNNVSGFSLLIYH